jgi:CO dehydrogenase maturation factor
MSFVIGFAGKGGTGKTSLAALTVRYLVGRRRGPVLAVDADSNSCLHEALGLTVHATIGGLREDALTDIRAGERQGGMSMEELFDYKVQQSVIESKGFDLMVMGRPEGPGCYCAANNIIRKYTDKFSESYPYTVIDNEAGMEHLSRRTAHAVDVLLVVSDASQRGLYTAKRINDLVDELSLDVKRRAFIINRVSSGDDTKLLVPLANSMGINVAGLIPDDKDLLRNDLEGNPVVNLPEDSPAVKTFFHILETLNIP